MVDRDGVPSRLGLALDDWQRADFEALDPALQLVAGISDGKGQNRIRAYLERGRGHSKTTDIAVCATWMLWASQRKIAGVIASGDRDQAGFVRNAIDTIYRLNPFLAKRLDVQRGVVVNKLTGSRLEVLATDAATSYGLLVDFIICDEFTHWKGDNGKAFWESLFSTAAKRANCLVLIIANAGLGMGTSWQWKVRELARTSPDRWYFSRLDGPVASWITPENLREQEAGMISPSGFRRLWLNEWLSASGDAINQEDIDACTRYNLYPLRGPELDFAFVAGLDLGIKKDRSALVVLGCNVHENFAQLAHCEAWAPGPNREVDLAQVEAGIIKAASRYPNLVVSYDPHQCEYMAQRLRRMGVMMEPFPFTGANCNLMATTLIQSFRTRTIVLYNDADLIRDLGRLVLVQKSFGFKLEAPSDASGHADRATALAIALASSHKVLASYEPSYSDGLGDSLI